MSKDFGVGERLASEVRGLLAWAGGVRPWPRGCLTLCRGGGWGGPTPGEREEAGTGWCDDLWPASLSRVSGAGTGGSGAPTSLSGTLDRDSELSPSLRSSFWNQDTCVIMVRRPMMVTSPWPPRPRPWLIQDTRPPEAAHSPGSPGRPQQRSPRNPENIRG